MSRNFSIGGSGDVLPQYNCCSSYDDEGVRVGRIVTTILQDFDDEFMRLRYVDASFFSVLGFGSGSER